MRSRQQVSRQEVVSRRGAVAATRYLEADAGVECLKEGGSAVDAAIAAAYVACVIEPFSTSIGGCGFMLVHDPETRRCWSIEFPTRAPQKAHADMFRVIGDSPSGMLSTEAVENNANAVGYLAAGVPATVAGLAEAHRMFGKLPMRRLVEPAVKLAREGFTSDIYYDAVTSAYLPLLKMFPGAAESFLVNGGAPVSLYGHKIRQPALADALETIGADSGASFYHGDIARAVVDDVQSGGGLLTLDDMSRYRPIVDEPLWGRYRGRRVAVPASPSGGCTVLQALKLLDKFQLADLPRDSGARFHLMISALRHAFADRYAWLGDPELSEAPLEALISEAYAQRLSGEINPFLLPSALQPDREPWVEYRETPLHNPWELGLVDGAAPVAGSGPGGAHGTVHVTAADSRGMLVSCTHTVGDVFGAKCTAGPGVLLNSGMQWFSPRPGGPNEIAGWKRPLANMAPAMVFEDDQPVLAAGAFGGRRIISAITQIISDVIDHGMSPQQACEAARVDASERITFISDRLGEDLITELGDRGHRLKSVREDHHLLGVEFANATAIGIDRQGVIRCGVDAIRPCEAIGY